MAEDDSPVTILVRHNAHYRVYGPFRLIDVEGNQFEVTSDPAALCRCGRSLNLPFCDGSHSAGFDAPTRATDPAAIQAASGDARDLVPQPRPPGATDDPNSVTILVRANGPYRVYGPARLIDVDGNEFAVPPGDWYTLCRCGHSNTMPFCDSTHKRIDFRPETRVRREGEPSRTSPNGPSSSPSPSSP
jgi:CDGSH iron-sulfur domain-containing protein 3